MNLQFTDKCAKHHFKASVKSSWLCYSMPSYHIAPQATIYSCTLTMIHYSLLTNLVKPMMLKGRRTRTSCDWNGAFMSNKALPCSPHPATRTIAPKLQLDVYNCTRLCSYSFLRHGWCCGGLALCQISSLLVWINAGLNFQRIFPSAIFPFTRLITSFSSLSCCFGSAFSPFNDLGDGRA